MESVAKDACAGEQGGDIRTARWRIRLSSLGLQGKLVLSFSLMLLIGLTVSSWLFAGKSSETLQDILGEQARQLSLTLAMAAEKRYVNGEIDELRRLGQDLLKSRNIVLIAFVDAKGKPLAVASRDPDFTLHNWSQTPESHSSTQHLMQVKRRRTALLGDFLQVTAPIFTYRSQDGRREGAQLLGYLTIGLSQNAERAEVQRVGLMGAGLGLLVFLLSLPLALVLVHRIFHPIRQLVQATNRIAGGDYDAQVAAHRSDEIGMLARSFNVMVRQIHKHQQELHVANDNLAEANRGLEEKVKQRTRELESTNGRLSSEIAEKEDFLRAVSHDLNAPLRNISGMATMLLTKHRERFDEDVVHRLERIRKNVEVETGLICELLELSRIKTRRQKMESVDAGALVAEVRDIFEEDLKSKAITLTIDSSLPHLRCEKARLRQVFQNLIDNAIKYMGEGPLREIHVGHRLGEDAVEVYVRDTGIGMDKEDAAKVFYVFRRGKNSAAMGVAGKGVGLASVKSIVETYDGRIWVQSELNKGSVLWFTMHKRFVPELSGTGSVEQETASDSTEISGAAA